MSNAEPAVTLAALSRLNAAPAVHRTRFAAAGPRAEGRREAMEDASRAARETERLAESVARAHGEEGKRWERGRHGVAE